MPELNAILSKSSGKRVSKSRKNDREPTSDVLELMRRMREDDPELESLYQEGLQQFRIAEQIRQLRRKKNLTQAQLAELVNTSQSVIARLESSKYNRFSMPTLTKIAAALGCTVEINLIPR